MENKEINSAVNKVETIAHQTENNETAQNVANEEIIQTENPIKHTKKVKTVKTVTPTTNEKRKQKAEKKAMLIAKKKQASIRKQEQLAAEKLRRKEERIKRRDLIKSENA